MTTITAFILGLLIGWLVEWVIDWVYWRRRGQSYQDASAQCQQRVATLEAELSAARKDFQALETRASQLESENLRLENLSTTTPPGLPGMPTPGLPVPPVAGIPVPGIPIPTVPGLPGTPAPGTEATRAPEEKPQPQSPDDLEAIVGIGPVIARMLNQNGIYTFEQLAAVTPEFLRTTLGDAVQRLADEESLIEQARQFALRKQSKGAVGQ